MNYKKKGKGKKNDKKDDKERKGGLRMTKGMSF